MEYAHEKAEAALKALRSDATDIDIVQTLTAYLMVGKHAPFVFKINHNAKAAPCPLIVHKVHGMKHCSVALRNPDEARNWCINALMRGYEVSCGTQRGEEVRSLARERDSIRHRIAMDDYRTKRAAAKARGEPDPDDEIPF